MCIFILESLYCSIQLYLDSIRLEVTFSCYDLLRNVEYAILEQKMHVSKWPNFCTNVNMHKKVYVEFQVDFV